MESKLYQDMAALEETHWWFVARRKILKDVIGRLPLPANASVLEAGCGTGGNLSMLSDFGKLSAFEPFDNARAIADTRHIGQVENGTLPDGIPFEQKFDLICAFDVLEHVENDAAALKALAEKLAPSGHIVITVPAFMFLWSAHDTAHHHYRRYTRQQMVRLMQSAGLEVKQASYFNTILFPAIVAARGLKKILGETDSPDAKMPSPGINRLLLWLFGAERLALRHINLPVGVSVLAVGWKA